MRRLFFFIFALILTLSSTALAKLPSQQEDILVESHTRAKEIIDFYPPEKFFIINLGLSTTSISAAFRAIFPDEADQNYYFRDLPIQGLSNSNLDELGRNQFDQFVRKVLPPDSVRNGREVVFVRVLEFGMSMEHFMTSLLNDGTENRLDVKLHFHLFKASDSNSVDLKLKALSPNVRLVYDPILARLTNEMGDENRLFETALSRSSRYLPLRLEEYIKVGWQGLVTNPKYRTLDMEVDKLVGKNRRSFLGVSRVGLRVALVRCASIFF